MLQQLSASSGADETTVRSEAANLVIQAASGDQAAWSRLVDHYARLVWAVTTLTLAVCVLGQFVALKLFRT